MSEIENGVINIVEEYWDKKANSFTNKDLARKIKKVGNDQIKKLEEVFADAKRYRELYWNE